MDEGDAIASQPLQYEAFSAEQPGAETLGEGNTDMYATGGAEERHFLAEHLAAKLVEVHGDNLAWIGSGEGDLLTLITGSDEGSEEERLAGDDTFSGLEKFAE